MGVAPSFAARLHDDITSGPARVYGASVVPTVASRLLCASVNPEFSDVQVVVGSETYHGHCVILSRVPFFAATLRHSFAESRNGLLEIRDADPQAFRLVWRAIYSDDLRFVGCSSDSEELWHVLELAHRFEMALLREAASHRLRELLCDNLESKSAAAWVARARRLDVPLLLEQVLEFISKH